jgi:hypothetical protein
LKIDCTKTNPIEYDILLRVAGQSLDEKIDELHEKILNKLLIHISIFIMVIVSIILFKLSNYLYILAGIFYLYTLWSIVKYIPIIRNYKLGRDGERSVAQYLYTVARQLSKKDSNMHVYNDLVDEKKQFNVDHVVVSKKGIFIFETKTYRKTKDITNKITSNGKELFKNGQKITSNIPLQVKGQVKWLQSELLQITGKKYEIIPTVAFVGWFVDVKKIDDIYITQAKTINNILENQYRDILYDDEELKRITSCIHKLATVTYDKHTDICK